MSESVADKLTVGDKTYQRYTHLVAICANTITISHTRYTSGGYTSLTAEATILPPCGWGIIGCANEIQLEIVDDPGVTLEGQWPVGLYEGFAECDLPPSVHEQLAQLVGADRLAELYIELQIDLWVDEPRQNVYLRSDTAKGYIKRFTWKEHRRDLQVPPLAREPWRAAEGTGGLTFRLDHIVERTTEVNADGISRSFRMISCVPLNFWTSTELPQPVEGDVHVLNVTERDTNETMNNKIGAFDRDRHYVSLQLPTAVFNQFWKVTEATDRVVRSLVIELELPYTDDGRQCIWDVTSAKLEEVMVQTDSKAPEHPVVKEIRVIRDQLTSGLKSLFWTLVFMLITLGAINYLLRR
jgi:hypothetical protein